MVIGLEDIPSERIDTGDVTLSVKRMGDGPPLVLLHGYPQNHMCWANVAPALAKANTLIISDLRGYGDSDAPVDDAGHTTYSKRRMAQDVVALARHYGHDRFAILGHDRGARVAYRLALDHPDRVTRLGIVEIVPTSDFWAAWSAELAMKAYHWTFLAQPSPMPETLISADPVGYIEHTLAAWTLAKSLEPFPPAALEAYRAQARDPARIAAMCADYRAGATTDRALDLADREKGRKITAPLKYLYAESGFPAQTGDPAALWRDWATAVTAASCESGHFAMEENPQAVIDTFAPFFAGTED